MMKSSLKIVCAVLNLALIVFFIATAPILASEAKVLVNGDVITTNEIERRAQLIAVMSNTRDKAANRKRAERELIEERLIQQAAKKTGVTLSKKIAERQFADIAKRNRMTPAQFRQAISRAGIKPDNFIERLHAALLWQKFSGTRIRASVKVSEQDIVAKAVDTGQNTLQDSEIYTVINILFVLPKNPSKAYVNRRLNEAKTLRNKIKGCRDFSVVERIDGVIIQDKAVKRAADMPPALRKRLSQARVGEAMAPSVAFGVIEMPVLCNKETVVTSAELFNSIEQDLIDAETRKAMRRVIYRLRRTAVIEYR